MRGKELHEVNQVAGFEITAVVISWVLELLGTNLALAFSVHVSWDKFQGLSWFYFLH